MSALHVIEDLQGRGFDLALEHGRVIISPAHQLTDADKQAIRNHLPSIKRLLSSDYSDLPDGWQRCQAMPSRAVLIHRGRLLDSVCFAFDTEASDFMRRIQSGEPAETAWKAASAQPQRRIAQWVAPARSPLKHK